MVASNSRTVPAMMSATGSTELIRPQTWPDRAMDAPCRRRREILGVAELGHDLRPALMLIGALVLAVRSARSAGLENWFRNTVSVSARRGSPASSSGAPAIPRRRPCACPSARPRRRARSGRHRAPVADAAGRDDRDTDVLAHQRQQHHGRHRLWILESPPSPPSTIRPSTPASTAFIAAFRVGTTWNTVSPAAFSARSTWSGRRPRS